MRFNEQELIILSEAGEICSINQQAKNTLDIKNWYSIKLSTLLSIKYGVLRPEKIPN